MSQTNLEAVDSSEVIAPLIVTAMVVHQPGEWFGEVLQGLVSQEYAPVRNVFFLTTPIVNSSPVLNEAQVLAKRITDILPSAVVRIVEGNPGFGVLINEVKRVVEGESGFFCVLHDDVVLQPNTLQLLVEETYISNAAVIGPKLVQWDDSTLLQSVGMGIDRCGEVDAFIERNERDQEQHDSVRDVFFVSSACMLIRADIFRELDGFCKDISFSGEDLEFCWRAHLSGARVVIAPTASVRHRQQFSQRSPELISHSLTARHRARSVATLTSRLHLPTVWLQMLLISVVETFVGIFSGSFRESIMSVRATLLLIVDGQYIWRRRGEVRLLRRVPSSDIGKLQVRGSARVTRFIRHRRAIASQEIVSSTSTGMKSSRLAGLTLLVVIALILVGSRAIITNSSRVVGDFLSLEAGSMSPNVLLTMFKSGWWSSGFGQTAANPTGLGLLAIGGYLVFGHLALLQTLIIVGSLFVGLCGMWRLCDGFNNTRVRLVGVVIFVATPLAFDSIAHGQLGGLLSVAAMPWVFDILSRAQRPNLTLARLTQLSAGMTLVLGVTSAFAPGFLIVAMFGIGLWALASVFGGSGIKSVVLVSSIGFVGLIGAILLNLPWSLNFVSADWWSLLAGDQSVSGRNVGRASLVRLDFDNLRSGSLGLATYICVGAALIIATTWRVVWALRSAALVVGGLVVAVLDDIGLLVFAVPHPSIVLALVPCGVALAGATCLSAFAETSTSRDTDWRRPIGLLVPVAIAVATLPTLLMVVDGRWQQPDTTVSQLLVQLPDNPQEGNYRTLFVGAHELLPVANGDVNSKIAYGIVEDGEINFSSYWTGQPTSMDRLVKSALLQLVDNDTVRVGRLVSYLAIRYFVVPLGVEPSQESLRVVKLLSNQIDLKRTYFARDLAIFENVSWLPIASVLDKKSAIASEQAGDWALTSQDLKSIAPLFVDGQTIANKQITNSFSGGTIYLAVPFDQRWEISVDGATVAPRIAFGATTAFDVPVAGEISLQYKTSPWRSIVLLGQCCVFLGLIILAANLSRLRNRIGRNAMQKVSIVADSIVKSSDLRKR